MTARLVIVAVLGFTIGDALVDGVRIAGAEAEPLLALTAVVGLRLGPRPGALVGFWSGLVVDLLVTTPLGLSALCFTLAGHGAGLAGERWVRAAWWIVPIGAAATTLAADGLFVAASTVLGDDTLARPGHLPVLLGASVWALPLGAVLSPLVGWAGGSAGAPGTPAWAGGGR